MAKGKAKRTRRISAKYREHLADVAALFVKHHGNKAATARAVRKLPGCGGFRPDYLRVWVNDPEFAALVKTEEERQAQSAEIAPDVRGPEKLAWLVAVEQKLREQFEAARTGGRNGDPDEKLAREILSVIHKHGAEVRAEEKHLADQAESRAKREFKAFLRNVMRYVKAKHAKTHLVVYPVLEDALQHLDAIVAGRIDSA